MAAMFLQHFARAQVSFKHDVQREMFGMNYQSAKAATTARVGLWKHIYFRSLEPDDRKEPDRRC